MADEKGWILYMAKRDPSRYEEWRQFNQKRLFSRVLDSFLIDVTVDILKTFLTFCNILARSRARQF